MNTRIKKVTLLGFLTNIVLSIIKLGFGFLGKSNSMIADGINSSLDIVNTVCVYIGLKVSHKPPDKNHPYGHYKAEILSTLLIAVMIGSGSINIVWTNAWNLMYSNFEKMEVWVCYAAVISILLKGAIFFYTNHVANEEDSISLKASAIDYKMDILLSIGVLIGVLTSFLGLYQMDSIIAIALGLFMLKLSYDLILEVNSQIMDEIPDPEKVKEIKKIASEVEGVVNTHFTRIRKAGALFLVDMDIVVNSELSLKEAHEICHNVVDAIKKGSDRIAEVRIHIDPYYDGDCR